MAVVDVVDGVAENVTAIGFIKNRGVEVTQRGGSDNEESAVEVCTRKGLWGPVNLAITDVLDEPGREFWRDDMNTSVDSEFP